MATIPTAPRKPGASAAGARVSQRRKRNRAGRPTADELERRKLVVMEVATQMFVEKGYAATTLLDIAKRARVATRTLYQHFGDKEDLFREVIFARETAIITPPLLEEGEDLLTALHKAAQYSYDVALRTRSIELMRLMIAESGRFPDLMSKIATKIFSRFTENVATLFRQLADADLIPNGNHAQSAELFVDLFLGNRTVMIYFGWLTAVPSYKDTAVKIDLFINGRFTVATAPAKPAKRVTKAKVAKPAAAIPAIVNQSAAAGEVKSVPKRAAKSSAEKILKSAARKAPKPKAG